MKSRSVARPLSTLLVCICAGCCASIAVAAAAQPPAAAASESSVTLKPKFKVGDTLRYRIKIERTDASIVPAAMMTPPAAPSAPAPDAKPAGDAPKSDPGVTDSAPDPTKTPAVPTAKPAAPAKDSAKPAAAEPEKKETVSATSRAVLDTVQVLKVKEVTDTGITMELLFESVKADIKMPEKEAQYDSTKPEDDKDRDNLGLQTFKPIIGLALQLTADKNGLITEVKGNETYQNASTPSMSAYLQALTGGDNIRINWNMLMHAKKGGGTFKVGDSWTNEESFAAKQLGAKFEWSTNSTLRAVAAGNASIDSTGTMQLVPNDPARKPPFDLKDGKILLTATWDSADSFVIKSECQRSFRLDGAAQGFPLTRQSEIKLTAERVK